MRLSYFKGHEILWWTIGFLFIFFPVNSKAKVKECILTKTERDVTNGDSGNKSQKKEKKTYEATRKSSKEFLSS